MDQQRRLLTFTVLSFLILFGWMSVGPKLFPGMFPPVKLGATWVIVGGRKPVPKLARMVTSRRGE